MQKILCAILVSVLMVADCRGQTLADTLQIHYAENLRYTNFNDTNLTLAAKYNCTLFVDSCLLKGYNKFACDILANNLIRVYFSSNRIHSLLMEGSFPAIRSFADSIGRLHLHQRRRDYDGGIMVTGSTIGELIASGNFRDISIIRSNFTTRLSFLGGSIEGTFHFATSQLPDTVEFSNVDLSRLKGEINFIHLPKQDKISALKLSLVDVTKFNLEYQYFELAFSRYSSFEEKFTIYQGLLNNFKQRGSSLSYEKLDKEFKRFIHRSKGLSGVILDLVDRHWWDYGYNKFLVVRNAILLNIIFFLINLFFFNKLVNHGYNLQKFVRINADINYKYSTRFGRILAKSPYIFLYTSYIFWGLRLDINNLGIHRVGLFSYILLQYLVGIICLAYIANLIITV